MSEPDSDEVRTYTWIGDSPYFLVIRELIDTEEDGVISQRPFSTVIDIDERGWFATFAEPMRKPSIWMLCDKKRSDEMGILVPVLVVNVEPGEQPYFVKKHIGIISMGGSGQAEDVWYGLGKKRTDGQTDRLWILPDGMVCVGEDVYKLGSYLVRGQL